MIRCAFIKSDICFNITVFESDEAAMEFKTTMVGSNFLDDIVPLPDEYGIGDLYVNGVWQKHEPVPSEPSLDDYLLDLDFRLSSIELGL